MKQPITKRNTRLTERIILFLAKNEPQSCYSITKKMTGTIGNYKNYKHAFDRLLKEGYLAYVKVIAKNAGQKKYPNKEAWLTERGRLTALALGTDPQSLRATEQKINSILSVPLFGMDSPSNLVRDLLIEFKDLIQVTNALRNFAMRLRDNGPDVDNLLWFFPFFLANLTYKEEYQKRLRIVLERNPDTTWFILQPYAKASRIIKKIAPKLQFNDPAQLKYDLRKGILPLSLLRQLSKCPMTIDQMAKSLMRNKADIEHILTSLQKKKLVSKSRELAFFYLTTEGKRKIGRID